jgi:hypothetical protein
VKLLCPYCGKQAQLVDSSIVYGGHSYGPIWDCRPCDAYVGCHRGTKKPLGRLANKELREWKKKAHAVFDPLWRSGAMRRTHAYAHLARIMHLPKHEAHIGMFDVMQCRKLVELLSA